MKKGVITMMLMFALLTTGSIVTLTGCGSGSCFGEDPANVKVGSINGFVADISNFLSGGNNDVYYDIRPLGNSVEVVDYDSVGFVVDIETVTAQLNKMNLSFLNTSYACDIVVTNINSITAINVISNVNYNGVYGAGHSLNDLFGISRNNFLATVNIMDYINEQYLESFEQLLFILSEAPETEATHTFTIEFILDDSRVFNIQLDPITIRP